MAAPAQAEGLGRPATRAAARSSARIAAVQALYQMELAATDVNAVIAEFLAHRLGAADESGLPEGTDVDHFAEVVKGVVARQREIDPQIDKQLAEGWRLKRVDSILRAALRAGVLELMAMPGVPARVVISEYVEVAHAFFDGDEPRVVNGVLDKLARRLREGELA
jgi:N utilization substance protein B